LLIHWIVDGVTGNKTDGWTSVLASNRYRATIPAAVLTALGHEVVFVSMKKWTWSKYCNPRPSVIVIGKLLPIDEDYVRFDFLSEQIKRNAQEARQAGVLLIADYTDDHFDHPLKGSHWREMVRIAQVCTVGTPSLAHRVREFTNNDSVVVDDPLGNQQNEPTVFQKDGFLVRQLYRFLPGQAGNCLRFVWYGHRANWAPMRRWAQALAPLKDSCPFSIKIVTSQDDEVDRFIDEFNRLHSPRATMGFISWSEDAQQKAVLDSHIVLVPSDPNDPKKVVKTSNRLVDGLNAGRYVIASELPAYLMYSNYVALTENPLAAARDYLERGDLLIPVITAGQAFVQHQCGSHAIAKQWMAVFQREKSAIYTGEINPQALPQKAITMERDTQQNVNQHRSPEWKNFLHQSLVKSWEDSPYPSIKITSYFPAYVEMFGHLVNKKCVFIETGILDGGSLFMWRHWLGPEARIIGIDLNPEATKWRGSGFEIFIGDQGDPEFWKTTLREIGSFDALLDDGGHQSFQQIVTAIEAIKWASNDCIIAVEDTFTSFMNDFSAHGSFSFLEYAKDATDILIGRSSEIYASRFPTKLNTEAINEFKNVYSIQFYSGIVAFHLNQKYSQTPELVKNKPQAGASDFRYEGVNSARIKWPTLVSDKNIVEVCGGKVQKQNQREKYAINPVVVGMVSSIGIQQPTGQKPLPQIKLNLGCGDKILEGYVNVDVVDSRAGKKPDVNCDIRNLTAFDENYADEVMAIHVVEHFWRWEIESVLKEWIRVLKPGGRLVLECPNLTTACEQFLEDPERFSSDGKDGQRTMWVFYGDPQWQDPLMVHRWGYTPKSLSNLLEHVGLVNARQEPAEFKLREPRDMRIVANKKMS
jgi:hypothetical protein